MALIVCVLLDVALLSLLIRILRTLLAVRRLIRGYLLAVTSSLAALIVRRNRWHLAGHDLVSR